MACQSHMAETGTTSDHVWLQILCITCEWKLGTCDQPHIFEPFFIFIPSETDDIFYTIISIPVERSPTYFYEAKVTITYLKGSSSLFSISLPKIFFSFAALGHPDRLLCEE